MTGILLRFYVQEKRKAGHILLYEWLLERARSLGIEGGSAFRALAGFGHHGVLREEHFYELAADLPIAVEFAVTEEQAARLLASIRDEAEPIFYTRSPVEFATTAGPR